MQRILIIDDTKNIRILLQTCLEAEGYQVQAVADGGAALDLLQVELFDLIFLDIKLPELSGTEVLRRLRSQGILTPVIIMTAFATIKNAVECTQLGAVTYLQKPFTAEKVRRIVADLLLSPSERLSLEDVPALIDRAEFNPAEAILKNALVENPLSAQVYYLLGRLAEARGNRNAAAKYYLIATQLEKADQE